MVKNLSLPPAHRNIERTAGMDSARGPPWAVSPNSVGFLAPTYDQHRRAIVDRTVSMRQHAAAPRPTWLTNGIHFDHEGERNRQGETSDVEAMDQLRPPGDRQGRGHARRVR